MSAPPKSAKKRSFLRSKYLVALLISIIITFIVFLTYKFNFLEKLEWTTYDFRFEARGALDPGNDIVILEVDQMTYDRLGVKWPYPMSYHAQVVDNLNKAGAKVICFDIIFDAVSSNPAEDSLFAQLIDKYDNVILAEKYQLLETPFYKIEQAPVRPNSIIREAEPFLGFVRHPKEKDNSVRRSPLVFVAKSDIQAESSRHSFKAGDFVPSFSLQAVRLRLGLAEQQITFSEQEKSLYLGDVQIPIGREGSILINYYGPPQTFDTIKYSQVMLDSDFNALLEKSPDRFRNKIVLIGVTLEEFHDQFLTPFVHMGKESDQEGELFFEQQMPGVEIHANAIKTVLDYAYISQMTDFGVISLIFIAALVTSLFTMRFGPRKSMIFVIFELALVGTIASVVFIDMRVWINMVYPMVGILLTFGGDVFYHYMTEERQKKYIRTAFSHYLNPSVVDQVASDPDALKLGGQKRVLTVMFSDIRGFTTLSESLDPEELTNFLNEYLTAMTDIILKNNGTVDKYMGDAIMAFWGAPLKDEDHAYHCCLTCLEQMRVLHEMQRKWRSEGRHEIDIGIGVNTGEVTVGNMGSSQRFDYTVLGDSVNLGSRLEGTNKDYGTNIIIAGHTYEAVKDRLITRQLDRIRVKGKLEPVVIYELIAEKPEDLPEGYMEAYDAYNQGIKAYFARNWDEAIACFEKTLDIIDDDGPAYRHLDQCKLYQANPPGDDWDGVYIKTSK